MYTSYCATNSETKALLSFLDRIISSLNKSKSIPLLDIEELKKRGKRNIEDAIFIKEKLIPIAVKYEHWNIVVFESYAVIELIMKGLICLTKNAPCKTHEIKKLVEQMLNILSMFSANNSWLPLLYNHYPKSGDGYCVDIDSDIIRVYRIDNDVYTQLGASSAVRNIKSVDEILRLTVKKFKNEIAVSVGDDEIIRRNDSTYDFPDESEWERGFNLRPNSERLGLLIRLGKKLRRIREKSFYGEIIYDEEKAKKVVSSMDEWLDAAACFFISD